MIKNRKAFTIVELVIVIAVIGILAGVLIPTFSNIIKNAHVSNDQQTAANVTKDLLIATDGQTITSEAQLMAALAKVENVDERLTPQSAQHGYHFWFDMKEQKIVVMTAKDVSEAENRENNVVLSAEPDGSYVSAVADDPVYANISFRDIFDKDYYLIDAAGSALADILNAIDNLSAGNKDTYKTAIIDAIPNLTGDDALAINNLKTRVEKTIIIATSGTFYHEGVTDANVYWANAMGSNANHYVYNGTDVVEKACDVTADAPAYTTLPDIAGDTVFVPDTVIAVGDYSLMFDLTADPTINLVVNGNVAKIFCSNSTNATINGKYKVVGNKLQENGADVATLETIGNRAPFTAFGFAQVTPENGSYAWVGNATDNPILYVYAPAYLDLADMDDNILQIFIQYNDTAIYNGPVTWSVSSPDAGITIGDRTVIEKVFSDHNGGAQTFEKIEKTYNNALTFSNKEFKEGTVIATATITSLTGETMTESFTIQMCKPAAANLVANATNYALPNNDGYVIDWELFGDNDEIVFDFAENNGYFFNAGNELGASVLPSAPSIVITTNDTTPTFEIRGNTLVLKTQNITDANKQQKFNVSVDGYLTTEFTVNVKTPFAQSKFYYMNTLERPYYIGSGGSNIEGYDVSFGDILKIGTADKDFTHIKLSAYIATASNTKISYHKDADASIKHNLEGLKINGADYTKPIVVTKDAFVTTKIDVTGKSEYTYNVTDVNTGETITRTGKNFLYFKLEACDANGNVIDGIDDAAIRLEVVNGKNILPVYKEGALDNATLATTLNQYVNDNATSNVVILSDIELVDSSANPLDSNYKLDINAGETLYGNGFIIKAQKFVSNQTTSTKQVQYYYCSQCQAVTTNETCKEEKGFIFKYWELKSGHTETLTTEYHPTYYGNTYMIKLDGGKVDNVYIDGPVYPTLQYYADDVTTTDNKNYAQTPYHISGVLATGDAIIANSYISGFRQPIQVNTTGTVTVDNTTLYGGNYANLQLVKGNLNINDVTTVQLSDGIPDTFTEYDSTSGTDNRKKVVGLGIAVEAEAIKKNADGTFDKSVINITGYLDQYNWIAEDTDADLPAFEIDGAKLDFYVILNAVFNGVTITDVPVIGTKNEDLAFLNDYLEETNDTKYLNAGIMFLAINTGNTAKNAAQAFPKTDVGQLVVNDERDINYGAGSGYVKPVRFGNTRLPLFSEYAIMSVSNMSITASKLMRALGDFTVGENGRAVAAFQWDWLGGIFLQSEIDVYMNIWSYKEDDVQLGAPGYQPIKYTQGYYVNYGSYSK